LQRSDIIDDVISINNSKFGDYVDQIHATELEKKMTPKIQIHVRMFHTIAIHLEFDSDGQLRTLRQKRLFQFCLCELFIYL